MVVGKILDMLSFVKCRLDGNTETEIELPKGKSIMLGGGAGADVRLTPYFQMPDSCARIWHDDHCLVENLTRKTSLVLLNGRPLHTVALFEKGDVLQIGVDQFNMSCREDEDKSPPPQPAKSAGTPATPQINYALGSTVVSPAVTRHSPVDPNWKSADMLRQLFTQQPTIVFANFRAAGIDPPAEAVAGADWFNDAPDEIREVHSLHAIVDGSPEERLQWVKTLGEKDAVLVAIPDGDIPMCLDSIKLFSGWFVRPSILEVTLTQGSRLLCEQLLRPFLGLIIQQNDSKPEWVVYSAPRVTSQLLLQAGLKPPRLRPS